MTNMFSCTYILLLGRYNDACLPSECSKTTVPAHARLKNRLLWTHNKWFMEPWFGVIAGGTSGPSQTKKEAAFGARTKIKAKDKNVLYESKANAVRYTRPNSFN